MAMISEFQEKEAKHSTFSSPPPKPVSFSSSLDTANPVGFLEKVFDFLAKESDFLGKENVDKEIAAVVRIAKEKNMKKVEEVALKVEIKKKEENEIKKEVKRMEVDKKEEKTSSGLKDDGTFYEKEAVRIERMEKSQQEFQERFLRTQEEIRELMALMKDMMAMIVKRKWVAENPSSQERPVLQDRREDPLYGYTPSYSQTSQEAYIPIMAPDRLSLQNLEMKEGESFKDYALRWWDVATQVQPPLTKRETVILFKNTLGAPYYDMLIGNATLNFADLVCSGEMIENAIKSGKLDVGEKNGGTAQENEEETSYPVYSSYPPYYPVNNVAPLTIYYSRQG